jgi:hypothetical protein
MTANVLDQQTGIQPDWLSASSEEFQFTKQLSNSFISSRVVFYPGSGVDYAPIELFKQSAHGYLYVDYLTDLDSTPPIPNCKLLHQQALTIGEIAESLGLDPNQAAFSREDLTPNETHDVDYFFAGQNIPESRLLGGRWSVWERNEVLIGETHHPRFALLQLHAEAVWVFKGLWCTREQRPKLFALYLGRDSTNWTHWRPGGWLFRLAVNHQVFPDWLRCQPDTKWPDYDFQFRDSLEEGSGVYQRTRDQGKLVPMNLFLRARDVIQGPLTDEDEEQLAESGDQPIERFWFLLYVEFLRINLPQGLFGKKLFGWQLKGWLDWLYPA